MCTAAPLNVAHNAAFLVDHRRLKNKNDVKCDDMGSWRNQGTRTIPFTVTTKNEDTRRVILYSNKNPTLDSNNAAKNQDIKRLKKIYFTNAQDKDVRKIVSYIEGINIL